MTDPNPIDLLARIDPAQRGRTLRNLRGDRLSQLNVADAGGLSQSMVSRLERGDPRTPRQAVVKYITALQHLGRPVELTRKPRDRGPEDIVADLIAAERASPDDPLASKLPIEIASPAGTDIVVALAPDRTRITAAPVSNRAKRFFRSTRATDRWMGYSGPRGNLLPAFVNRAALAAVAARYQTECPGWAIWAAPPEPAITARLFDWTGGLHPTVRSGSLVGAMIG